MMDIRVGQGYDSHRLVEGRKLILAGVEIPYELGLLGVSDADVAAHALIDALLGASGLGNIGQKFPEKENRGADSMVLLADTVNAVAEAGFTVVNADITIIAQSPRLDPYTGTMRENLACALKVDAGRVGVKPKTNEKMGFTGRGEGIAAICSVLLLKSETG